MSKVHGTNPWSSIRSCQKPDSLFATVRSLDRGLPRRGATECNKVHRVSPPVDFYIELEARTSNERQVQVQSTFFRLSWVLKSTAKDRSGDDAPHIRMSHTPLNFSLGKSLPNFYCTLQYFIWYSRVIKNDHKTCSL